MTSPAPLGAAPSGTSRRRARLFILLFVAFELLTPLTYYLRDDPYDERFAWRMFSEIRMYGCQTAAFDVGPSGNEQRIDLARTIHPAWLNTLSRNRRDVILAFLRRRCREPDVRSVRLVNTCQTSDGKSVPAVVWERDCTSGAVTEPTEHP